MVLTVRVVERKVMGRSKKNLTAQRWYHFQKSLLRIADRMQILRLS